MSLCTWYKTLEMFLYQSLDSSKTMMYSVCFCAVCFVWLFYDFITHLSHVLLIDVAIMPTVVHPDIVAYNWGRWQMHHINMVNDDNWVYVHTCTASCTAQQLFVDKEVSFLSWATLGDWSFDSQLSVTRTFFLHAIPVAHKVCLNACTNFV